MFRGTMIEELIQMVQRAEEHARMEAESGEQTPKMNLFPGFFYGATTTGSSMTVGVS